MEQLLPCVMSRLGLQSWLHCATAHARGACCGAGVLVCPSLNCYPCVMRVVVRTPGGKAPAGAARLALALDGSETEEQLAQVNSVDAVVALLDTPVSTRVEGSV